MRRLWACGAVLALVLGGIVVAADDDQPPQTGWGAHNVYRHKDKPAEKPPEKPKVDPEEAKQPTLEQEKKAFERRLAVCQRLLTIAQDANDTELEEQALRLNDKVNTLWQQRLRRLGSKDSDDKGAAPKASSFRASARDAAGPREVQP